MPSSCFALQQKIIALLPREIGCQVEAVSVTDSTNARLKQVAKEALLSEQPVPCRLLLALHQTAGRGRLGRSFYSPQESGLYFSLLFPVDCSWEEVNRYTCVMAVSMAQTVEAFTSHKAGIKWVNDIYVKGKKVCGILGEAVACGGALPRSVVMGVGVNLTPPSGGFPPELSSIAGALWEESPSTETKAAFCAEAVKRFFALAKTDVMPAYRERSLLLGQNVTYLREGVFHSGKAVAIDDRAGLVLETESGEQTVLSCGEVSVRPVGGAL